MAAASTSASRLRRELVNVAVYHTAAFRELISDLIEVALDRDTPRYGPIDVSDVVPLRSIQDHIVAGRMNKSQDEFQAWLVGYHDPSKRVIAVCNMLPEAIRDEVQAAANGAPHQAVPPAQNLPAAPLAPPAPLAPARPPPAAAAAPVAPHQPRKTVFISYAWEARPDEDKKQWDEVKLLIRHLLYFDIGSVVDRHSQIDVGGMGVGRWTEVKMEECDKILVLVTPTLLDKVRNKPNARVNYELGLVTGMIARSGGFNHKLIPVVMENLGGARQHVPVLSWLEYAPVSYPTDVRGLANRILEHRPVEPVYGDAVPETEVLLPLAPP